VNRWALRILGILLLLVFALIMLNLQRQLVQMERSRRQPAATTTTTPP